MSEIDKWIYWFIDKKRIHLINLMKKPSFSFRLYKNMLHRFKSNFKSFDWKTNRNEILQQLFAEEELFKELFTEMKR